MSLTPGLISALDLFRKLQGLFRRRYVERGDDWVPHGLNIKWLTTERKPKKRFILTRGAGRAAISA